MLGDIRKSMGDNLDQDVRLGFEVLQDNGFRVDILTKSNLVLRDLDIIGKFNEIEIGLTLTAMDDRVRVAFEPGASTVQERLDALKKISDQGIPTYAFVGPLLPYLSEERLEDLFNALADRDELDIVVFEQLDGLEQVAQVAVQTVNAVHD
jgi:DNA repair photolyase